MSEHAATFEALRPKLFGIAYRMLQTRSEAEDVVQEAWVRLSRTSQVASPEAFLVRTTTRLCLDVAKSARKRRESYVGPWLPEPLLTTPGPEQEMERLDALSLALLRVIERLSPLERAVFLLREAFGYGYDEIAEVVERRTDHCRQIAKRARDRVRSEGGDQPADADEHARLLHAFLGAAQEGDLEALEELMTEDVVLVSDGGGRAVAATRPVLGRRNVARFMAGISTKAPAGTSVEVGRANGLPAALVRTDGVLTAVFTLDVRGGRIRQVLSVRNPDKLGRSAGEAEGADRDDG